MTSQPPVSALQLSTHWKLPASIFALCLAYALIRYSVFGPVPVDHWPAYIFNKAVSVFAIAMLAISAWHYRQGKKELSKLEGRWVWHGIVIHSLLSLGLLNSDYYPKFFAAEGMNLLGEWVLLLGVMGSYVAWQISHHHGIAHHRLKRWLCALGGLHLIPMASSWAAPASWHGSMPPMSLISFLIAVLALFFYWRYKGMPDA